MTANSSTVLVVGATGSVGRLVVEEALREGYSVRALVRNAGRARGLAPQAQPVVGDLTRPETLGAAVEGVDAIVFTHGSDGGRAAEAVDYGGVRNVLFALDGRPARIALMTLVGATNPNGYGPALWKRRSERLVRATGLPYTIVRPGWFDYNDADQLQLVARQGDTRWHGGPRDGVVSRRQLAQVLVRSLALSSADRKTFELDSERGPATADFDAFFAPLEADPPGALDGIRDRQNQPLEFEPPQVRDDLERIGRR
ncbi:SDR family oxidoreductase [Burkholderia multivorans]|uniref:SDR family oxidoreductase n=1 Tax=Burkholderia multivorans TaxID=87883 RepID=UPI0021C0158A|nr:SDR family oxidoreductase [Burkholderia multivorans]